MRYPTPALWRCRMLYVYDGDTPTVEVDRGIDERATWNVRLKDVWAPELRETGGQETRNFVLGWFYDNGDGSDWPFMLETFRTPRSDVEEVSFSRYIGRVTAASGRVLNHDVKVFVGDAGYGSGAT